MTKSYSELISMPSFDDRLDYLRLSDVVGDPTFGSKRYLYQDFLHSREWRDFKRTIILRDGGCDLAHADYPIDGDIYVHHINPITEEDFIVLDDPGMWFEHLSRKLMNPENLVCVSFETHNDIHYGSSLNKYRREFVERTPFDTCPWRIKKG